MMSGGTGKTWTWRTGGSVTLALTPALFLLAFFLPTFPGDEASLLWLQSQQYPWLTTFMRTVSVVG